MSIKAPISYSGELWDAGTKMSPAIMKAAEEARMYGLALVKSRTPVKTGNLKNSWAAQLQNKGVLWTNSAPYAGFVELGTRKMAAREMLTNSIPAIETVFTRALATQIGIKLAVKVTSHIADTLPNYGNITAPQTKQAQGFNPRLSPKQRQLLGS